MNTFLTQHPKNVFYRVCDRSPVSLFVYVLLACLLACLFASVCAVGRLGLCRRVFHVSCVVGCCTPAVSTASSLGGSLHRLVVLQRCRPPLLLGALSIGMYRQPSVLKNTCMRACHGSYTARKAIAGCVWHRWGQRQIFVCSAEVGAR